VIKNPYGSVEEIPDISTSAKKLVAENFQLMTTELVQHSHDDRTGTSKLLVRLQDGALVETVGVA
jgi:adenine C2-methylase RlmN of 23S rRNA A2503 and tRNA A37